MSRVREVAQQTKGSQLEKDWVPKGKKTSKPKKKARGNPY